MSHSTTATPIVCISGTEQVHEQFCLRLYHEGGAQSIQNGNSSKITNFQTITATVHDVYTSQACFKVITELHYRWASNGRTYSLCHSELNAHFCSIFKLYISVPVQSPEFCNVSHFANVRSLLGGISKKMRKVCHTEFADNFVISDFS